MKIEHNAARLEAFLNSSFYVGDNWKERFIAHKNGKPKGIRENVILVLANDPDLRGKISVQKSRVITLADLPWRKHDLLRLTFTDYDLSGLAHFLETKYSIANGAVEGLKLFYALVGATSENLSFNRFSKVKKQ